MRAAPTPPPPLVPYQTTQLNVPKKLSKTLPRKAPLRASQRMQKKRPRLHTHHYTHGYNCAVQHLAHSVYQESYDCHIAALGTSSPVSGKKAYLTKLLQGPEASTWEISNANEWGRLLEFGIGNNRLPSERVTGTGTIFFIKKEDFPGNRKVSYANYVCNIRPHKIETHRVRITAGGDRLDHPGDARSTAMCILDAKLDINSTIYDAHKGARYLGNDMENYTLARPCNTTNISASSQR